LRFFLDESVPDSVGATLAAAGHDVIYHRQALEQGVKDPVVCQTAMKNDAILIAVDGDMKQLSKRFGTTDERFKNLNLIMCACGPVMASKRIDHCLDIIKLEWEFANAKGGRRLWIEIGKHAVTTYR
jgi:predicted nuclease of predicted toxin-antitoxin system